MKTVWILDTDKAAREVLKALVEARGQRAVELENLDAAIEILCAVLEKRSPRPTLVIYNRKTLAEDRMGWLQEIRKYFPNTRIQAMKGKLSMLGQLLALLEQSQ